MSEEEVTISIDATQSGEQGLREILQERARVLSEVPASEERGGEDLHPLLSTRCGALRH